jgi:GNAT superfamily N-acetyltransferase
MQLIKKVFGKISYWKRTVVLFVWKPDYNIANSILYSNYCFSEIQSICNFPLGFVSDHVEQEYLDRFSKQHFCCVLTQDDQILAYGWVNPQHHHFIGELDVWVDLKEDTEMLYDFATNENYRGQGLYPYLLQKICTRNAKNKLIYILSNNNNSRKGILKANFKLLGLVKGINKNKLQRLLKNI